MRLTRLARLHLLSVVIVIASTGALNAQTYTVLYNLGTATGDPHTPAWMGLFAQGRDGNMYTTSTNGGVNNNEGGTAFQLSPAGKVTVLHSFAANPKFNDGAFPQGGLMLGTDGNFYGTTPTGGIPGFGTVFKITPSGKFTIMHGFNGVSEGESPVAPPVQGNDGNFYGTTSNGGGDVFGTVYKMTPSGKLTTLFTFDGVIRYPTDLILGTDGNFYGTTLGGSGTNVNGTIFKITPHGKFTLLHSFNGTDGQRPMGGIIQATDGNFYGTTRGGGSGGEGVAYKMTPAGVLTVLRNFANDTFGLAPFAGLVQATDGNFYGATTSDPGVGFGTLFQLTSKGIFTDLVFLTNVVGKFPGADPQVTLFQHTTGTLYGQTYGGGSQAKGVIYSLGMGLGPFVSFVGPDFSGKVGNTIEILGQGLTGATKVSFHGVSATFSVVSDTYMTAVVPAGATTGSVTVATHGGKLTSNRVFRVTPAILSFSPTSGPVGTQVTITGTSFTGAKKVSFGGVKAITFSVDSDIQITATVPTGALTGKIQVFTPGGTANSSGVFTVTQ